ncbi:hypothetical protein GYN14_09135 [Lactococcus piscium]|jgi:hypothetical protein|uniref:hypothetical protein n=1 Tax=Pseudolactococcus carnosus TaxID=2749961 RepID=UPI001FBA8F74|nr:hypothetical protein [Lactococcus carnosus]MBR6894497.1 hypothetical protein [Lactococcus sp.]MCJ1992654.1 hypothetical protein [Lactococcus carnosus]
MKKITCMATLALTLLGTAGVATSAHADELSDKAQQVIKGDFGNGQDRKEKLGQDYDRVQSKVNELLGLASVPNEASLEDDKAPTDSPATSEVSVSQSSFSTASVTAQTQYSHTENGHVQGGYYAISSSTPNITISASGKTVAGTVSRGGIGLEKGTIILAYVLNFDANDVYTSGSVTSSGYVDASITLAVGQKYAGQTINFLSTSGGRAGSGSYIYPITANLNLN